MLFNRGSNKADLGTNRPTYRLIQSRAIYIRISGKPYIYQTNIAVIRVYPNLTVLGILLQAPVQPPPHTILRAVSIDFGQEIAMIRNQRLEWHGKSGHYPRAQQRNLTK